MAKRIILAAVCLCGYSHSSGQVAAAPGTYELLTIEPKAREVFPAELLVTIEAARDAVEERYLRVGRFTWARIPSRARIAQADFVALPEQVLAVPPEAIPGSVREP